MKWRVPDQEVDQRGLGERLCKKTQGCILNRDAIDRSRWRKLIKMVDDQNRCEWVNVSSGTAHPGSPRQRAIKRLLLLLCYFGMSVLCMEMYFPL